MSKPDEYHIASFVAQCDPNRIEQLTALINSYADAEVHGDNDQGKIVFTVEGDSQKAISKTVDQIRLTDEFFSISPVYHQFLTEPETVEVK